MTAHNLTGTATDPLGADDTDGLVLNSTAAAPMRTVHRAFMENRIGWGSAQDAINNGLNAAVVADAIKGPLFSDNNGVYTDILKGHDPLTENGITLSIIFHSKIPCTLTGCRIYKAPNAVDATGVTVGLWSEDGTLLMTQLGPVWVVDGGGWVQIDFSSPPPLDADTTYVLGYYNKSGIYAWSPWVWNAQQTVVWPLVCESVVEFSGVFTAGVANNATFADPPPLPTTLTFPTNHVASNYYIDPQIEWDDAYPAYEGGTAYFDQFVTPHTRHAFPIGVFFSDPPYLSDYYDMGVNTLFAGSPVPGVAGDAAAYPAALAATGGGNAMDWWPTIGGQAGSARDLVQFMTENPDIADQIVGYTLWDEPDLSGTYQPPATMRGWLNTMRERDSTRPIYMTMGRSAVRNQGYSGAPLGSSMLVQNELWREWTSMADVVACDDYSWWDNNNIHEALGVWAYAAQVGRMREITDGTKPIFVVVETTSQVPGAPNPTNVVKAIWAGLIAGARGVVLFDHRFANQLVTTDFAAMLSDAPMKAAITALAAQLQTLAPALMKADAGLVTAWTSSNTTAGPLGGTWGVPLHYTSRIVTAGTEEYVFVQAIREGATNATITIPSWAGETVEVIGEARNEVVSGGGVITDTFAADYQYHLYKRT